MKFESEHYKYFTYLLNKYLILKEKFKEISNRDYKLNILLNQKYSDLDGDISKLINLIDNWAFAKNTKLNNSTWQLIATN